VYNPEKYKVDSVGCKREDYIKILTEYYQEDLNRNLFTFIAENDSKTGKIVSFYKK
jgi:hypothetical protein